VFILATACHTGILTKVKVTRVFVSSYGYLYEVVGGWLSSGYTPEAVNKNTAVMATFVKLSAVGSLAVTHQKQ
jgi:hypothetical protein